MTLDKFLATLFDAGQHTCFTDSPYGYRIYEAPINRDVFFAINALHADQDLQPTKEWHDPNVGRRADCNVSCFRNLLLEIDSMELADQRAYVDSLNLPYTSIVYSGAKSNHFLISLETPLPDYDTYMDFSRRLHKLASKADPSTKNPSRLSRLPFRVRPETGLEQKLVYLGSRIPNEQLLKLLPNSGPKPRPMDTPKGQEYISVMLRRAIMEPDEVMQELRLGGRNQTFYYLGQRMKDFNVPAERRIQYVETAYNNLRDRSGFSLEEAYMAARVKF